MMVLLSCSKTPLSGWRRHPLHSQDKFLKDVKDNTVVFPPASLLLCTHFGSFIATPLLRRVNVHPFLAVLSTPQVVCPCYLLQDGIFSHRPPSFNRLVPSNFDLATTITLVLHRPS
jgi:hypothetical protein